MMRNLFLTTSIIFLSSCTASNVNLNDLSSSAYAPTNELKSSGEVSYCNAGLKDIKDARREDAYKKMFNSCGGKYSIIREEDQAAAFCTIERRIWFKCEKNNK